MNQPADFLTSLETFYNQAARDLPWRQTTDPYRILVSELMLQQTQVSRVIPKYLAFLRRFPTIHDLAAAPLSAVLTEWVGLGYNRRARYLHDAAKALAGVADPWTLEELVSQKGIGSNTAAAILVYAYNQPQLFIETNVRTVMLHHFFADRRDVTDHEIRAALQAVVPWEQGSRWSPRDFYWALMDYGTYLKAVMPNPSRRSKHHTRQSAFEGSRRQLRGRVIRLLKDGPLSEVQVRASIDDPRLKEVLQALQTEKLLVVQDTMLMLYNET